MNKDHTQGVLLAFRTHIPDPVDLPPLYLRGLDPDLRYTITGIKEYPTPRDSLDTDAARSGQAWMHAGLQLSLANFQSRLLRIQRV
jgi:hypothetical protein